MARLFLLLWTFVSALSAIASSKKLCSRIFFQNINEETMPYKMIEGVYIRQKINHNGLPVYQRENDDLLFYYYISKNGGKYLVFGFNLQVEHFFGVAAAVYSAADPVSWLTSGSLDRSDVFEGLINKWLFFNVRDEKYYYVAVDSLSPMIKAVCVDEDFRQCNSDRLYFNVKFNDGKENVLNHPSRDYFSRKQGVFRNLRPVYEHSSQKWYLQYIDGYWIVTGAYLPGSSNDRTIIKIKDFALRPEYISKTWSVHYSGWRDMPKLRILCRGVNSKSHTCPLKPCVSNSTCVYTSDNETLCLCPSGYWGVTCSSYKQCPTPHPLERTELSLHYLGKGPGDLGLSFCSDSYPSVRFSLCVDAKYSFSKPYWRRQGTACLSSIFVSGVAAVTTKRPSEITTPRDLRINFDDNPLIIPVVLTCVTLTELLLPFIVYYCAKCKKKYKEWREKREDRARLQEVSRELERGLQQVARAGNQEERNRGVQDYQRTVKEYQSESEEKELRRKRGLYRNVNLLRLISMHSFFSFYLWLMYLGGCEISQCTQYGRIFFSLKIFGMVVLCIASIIIFVESIFSHELSYLRNIMQDETAWGYIQKMHEVAPVISMVVECYHYETFSVIRSHMDANGNLQYYTDTFTRRVLTFLDQEEFSYGSWVDVSKREMPAPKEVSLTRVRIDPCIMFGDQETADDYKMQVAAMIERNRFRDDYADFSARREIPGLERRIAAYVDLSVKPWWIHPLYFWLATLVQMTWPYRWLFRAKTSKNYYSLKKKMYKSTTPPREADLMDPIPMLEGDAPSTDFSVPESNQLNDGDR